jgi:hypothetical protein
MSGLLYGVGAFAVVVGVVMVGFGVPISEFSFGNTLIGAGTTAAVGGLIIIGLGAAVARLQQIVEALATRAPIRPDRPVEAFEMPTGSRAAPTPAPGRSPFPPKPISDAGIREPHPMEQRVGAPASADMPVYESPAQSFAPTLRNPDEPPATVEDEISLSPQQPIAAPAPSFAVNGSGTAGKRQDTRQDTRQGARQESTFDTGWQSPPPPAAPAQTRQPQTAYFDTMWPDEGRPAKSPAGSGAKVEPERDLPPRDAIAVPVEPPASDQRAAAILKSGVVDGMGYTLYVDGSIEAELPQGTLRFASINELRSHLEKNP